MKRSLIAFLGMASLFLISSCGSTAKIQVNPSIGEDYHYMSNTEMDMAMMSMNIEMKIKSYFTLNATEKQDTTFHLKMKYDSLMISQSNPMSGSIDYNSNTYDEASADQTTKMIASAMETLKNTEVDIWVSTRGHVVKIEGMEDMAEAGGMMQGTDPSGVIKSIIIPFPEGEIKEGQSWTVKQSSGSIGVESTVTYTVKSIGSEEITLDMATTVPEGKEMETNGVTMTISDFDSKGEAKVERKTGMLLEMKTTQSMSMDMSVQGMEMSATTDSKTEVKRLR